VAARRRTIRVDGVFDVECAAWSHFILGVTAFRDGAHWLRVVHYTIESLVDELLSRPGTWWAHNGGKYDLLAVAEELRRRGLTMSFSMSGERVSRAVGCGLTLCDSYALIPMGLERVGDLGGVPAPRLDWPCRCGRGCGGYCSISRSMDGGRLAQLAEYCAADTESLLSGMEKLCEHAEEHDYDLRGTIGGSAWATAQRWLELPDADLSPPMWRRIRNAYHGGRCQVLRPMANHGRHWDLSSSYPAALATTMLPVGEPTEHGATSAAACYRRSMPGVYSCTVDMPESLLPVLPWVHAERTAYPHGEVHGAWTLPELEAAEERGARVTAVRWCVAWPGQLDVFGSTIRAWTDVRARVGKSSALGAWQRLLANSLCGKLAESPDRRFVSLHPERVRVCGGPPCTADHCRCGSYRQIDFWGELWSVPFYRVSKSSYVHWGAYTTSVARLAWLRGAESQGDGLVYGDTDSLWTTSRHRPAPAGEALGEWALKGTWADWEASAPKHYSFVDGETGEVIVRSSGATLGWREWREGGAVQDRGVMSLVAAARESRGLFVTRHQRWTLPRPRDGWYGDRVLDPATGVTHAVTCEQIRQRETDRNRTKQGEQTTQASARNAQ
jgi:hypothetical protein